TYKSGEMGDLLNKKLSEKNYNKSNKKDYYFIVLNKKKPGDIIVNSVRGLTLLAPNINNLPFQVCWNKNREFKYEPIKIKINLFVTCLQATKSHWKEIFLMNMKSLKI